MTAWLKLLRLPNVFTAVADVVMGYVVSRGELQPALHVAMLVGTSCLLYLSGMVLNDVFDAAVDAVEQPHRPIPSGRISSEAAASVGWVLWCAGIAFGWATTVVANDWRPGLVASVLALLIMLYNGGLKSTRLGPLVMGECRFMNVLLGMSLSLFLWGKAELLIAAGVGVYVLGVTIFAATDAMVSRRSRLGAGLAVLLGGMGLLAAVPWLSGDRPPLELTKTSWYFLWGALATITLHRCWQAIREPSSPCVQRAVRHCVQSIIAVDAAVCVGYAEPMWAFAVLGLFIPTLVLTIWLRAT
ncbi:MAG: UbiA family prenyltransferase [Pirellulales bacterium]|nr:UbiA family prenyltransferase [Pirellulales bacterium]